MLWSVGFLIDVFAIILLPSDSAHITIILTDINLLNHADQSPFQSRDTSLLLPNPPCFSGPPGFWIFKKVFIYLESGRDWEREGGREEY